MKLIENLEKDKEYYTGQVKFIELVMNNNKIFKLYGSGIFKQEFSEYYKWLEPVAQHIIHNEWTLNRHFQYFISNSWVNVHGKGGYTRIHTHGPCTLTTAAYLNLPESGGYIEFLDPLEQVKLYHMKDFDEEEFNWKKVEAKTGDVLIFPGWIKHRTQPNESDENRWVLTSNYISTQIASK